MRAFHLIRTIDDSGVSGVGLVGKGICFEDGVSILHWIAGKIHSTTVYNSIEEVVSIHGHGGHTTIKWVWDEDELL